MRKIVLTMSFVCLSVFSFAQISKGSVYFGGSIGYTKTTEERTLTPTQPQVPPEGDLKSTVISPSFGMAVKQNLIAGINFSYGKYALEAFNNINRRIDQKVVGGGVFLRRYYPLAKKFYAYGEASAGYSRRSWKEENISGFVDRNETKESIISASIEPGLSYNLTKSFYLEMGFADLLQVAYINETQTQSSGSGVLTVYTAKRKTFDISSGFFNSSFLNVGVRFIIPKKQAAPGN